MSCKQFQTTRDEINCHFLPIHFLKYFSFDCVVVTRQLRHGITLREVSRQLIVIRFEMRQTLWPSHGTKFYLTLHLYSCSPKLVSPGRASGTKSHIQFRLRNGRDCSPSDHWIAGNTLSTYLHRVEIHHPLWSMRRVRYISSSHHGTKCATSFDHYVAWGTICNV